MRLANSGDHRGWMDWESFGVDSYLSFGSFANEVRISVLFLSPGSWGEVYFDIHTPIFLEP